MGCVMTRFLFICIICALTQGASFVKVSGSQMILDGAPYKFVGTNYWYGMNLAMVSGDRGRLARELNNLSKAGVTNLRIMASSEGPDTEPYRMLPPLQPSPGVYSEEVLIGLDFLLDKMRERNLRAVLCLNNFWHWSGGFSQYVAWAEGGSIPYPPQKADYDTFQEYAARFYSNSLAREWYRKYVQVITSRINTVNGMAYRDDPTIMAWEMANEPRGASFTSDYLAWVEETAGLLKKYVPNQLVTIGSEGTTPYQNTHTEVEKAHSIAGVDYLTYHIWTQNWSIYNPKQPDTFNRAVSYAKEYSDEHLAIAAKLGKPAVLEEFGLARDDGGFSPHSTTVIRDKYFSSILDHLVGSNISGVAFWAYAGEGRPQNPGGEWRPGEVYIGDPPHEPQGWYSVYDHDVTTLEIFNQFGLWFR